jgi:hypothetical protein
VVGLREFHFDEGKKKASSDLRFTMQEVPVFPKQQDEEDEDENVGTEAAESAAHSLRQVRSSHQLRKEQSSRTREASTFSDGTAKQQQKQTIKRQYAAAKQEQDRETVKRTGEAAAGAARKAVEKAKETVAWIREHKKGFALILAGLMLAAFLLNMVSSCGIMMEGVISGIAAGSYPVSDEIILAAEASYMQREEDLRQTLDSYERNHSYHAYTYDLDPIEHDPYILMAILCALHPGAWTLEQVEGTMDMLFEKHYILTRRIETQTRWRNIETGEDCEANDPLGEPYPNYICHLALENFDLSHVPIHIIEDKADEMLSDNKANAAVQVYPYSGETAEEAGDLEWYRQSHKLNIACKNEIEWAIAQNYSNNTLNDEAVHQVVAKFGLPRTAFVLVNTIREKDWDGRISQDNKNWARRVPIYPDVDAFGQNKRLKYVVGCHPGLTDIFVNILRREYRQQDLTQPTKASVMEKLKQPTKRNSPKISANYPGKER